MQGEYFAGAWSRPGGDEHSGTVAVEHRTGQGHDLHSRQGSSFGVWGVPAPLTWTGLAVMSPSRTACMRTVRRSRYVPAAAVRPGYVAPLAGQTGRVVDPAARQAVSTSVGIAPVGRISNPCAVAQPRAGCGPRRDFGPWSSAAARVPSRYPRSQSSRPGAATTNRRCVGTSRGYAA